MRIDPRFSKDAGFEVFTGNELLVKGALEAQGGVHLFTGYPGSPVAGFFDALEGIGGLLADKGIVAKIANNEALSMAMVNGAQMAGCRAITAFKSVGLHVASDALALGVLAGTREVSIGPDANGKMFTSPGGGIVVIGDDPWSESTQVPTDSRFMAEHLRLPIIEPCSPQEVKDWIDLAFKIGAAGQIYIGYSMQPLTADGGGTVECRPNQYPQFNENQKRSLEYEKDIQPLLEQTVLLPPRTGKRELDLQPRLEAVKNEARRLGINRILHRPAKDEVVPVGFVAYGVAYAYLAHALAEMGLSGKFPILKIGMAYPLDEQLTIDFAKHCQKIVVIEERRPFVERQVVAALHPLYKTGEITTEIYGKRFPATGPGNNSTKPGIPDTAGLNPSMLIELLVPLIKELVPNLPSELANGRLPAELARIQKTSQQKVSIPDRTPTFCPGCPHRDSSSVLLELRRDLRDPLYMLKHHRRKPVDLVCHGDTGCYTMLMFAPNEPLMHNYSGMGLGGATGSGIDPFIDNKQLVFMGDGTFFHSGQVAISHSIKAGQDIAYIILDNKTTAMTGHQSHAGTETDLRGNPTFAQDIERIVSAMIPKELAKDVRIVRIDPSDRDRYRKLLEQSLLDDGVKIIVADKECGITHYRRENAKERDILGQVGFLPRKTMMNVATEVCEYCLECTTQTGCPGLKITETDYGPKVQTDLSTCVNDGACQRIDACPSFEEVTILRKQAPRRGDEQVDLKNIPDPPRPIHADQETWRCFLTGVGGMGIGLCTAILVTAGRNMGYHVQFMDRKGLAIRNGGVFSQLVFNRPTAAAAQLSAATMGHDNAALLRAHSSNTPSQVTTPVVPYGKADLLLGIDLVEACRAIDPKHPNRVASPERTAAVINTAKTATVLTLMGRDDFQADDLEKMLKAATHPAHYVGFNVGDLCERMLDTRLYANIMMLGVAYQKGLLPLTHQSIESAIRTVARHETARNLRAFAIGRRIALEPEQFVVEPTHEYESAVRAFRRKNNLLRAIALNSPKGKLIAKHYRVMMKQAFRVTKNHPVDDALMRDFAIRTYDCLIWGGVEYARQYCDKVVEVFRRDDPQGDFPLTHAIVWNLAKVMLIKDEVYVAAMLTSPEKYKRDRKRFNVNPATGDRLIYRHHNRPEFEVFGFKFRFEWKSTDWQLRLLAKMHWLRKLLPGWHHRERSFRDWYLSLVDQMLQKNFASPADRQRWVAVLALPASVTGYREVRYPKMEAVRQQAARLLALSADQLHAGGPLETLVNPPPQTNQRSVSLPLLSTARV